MSPWTSTVGAAHLTRLLGHAPRPEAGAIPARVPAYRALADRLRFLVVEGRLAVATRLPAERELAAALSLSRTTVAAAYEALRADGFLLSRRGAGSWTTVPAGAPLPTGGLDPLPPEAAASVIDLGYAALPAPEPLLTRALTDSIEDLRAAAHTHGDFPGGLPALREAIAERYTAGGTPTMPEQIMVTTGAIGGVAAVCRLLALRGERVAVEHPSYANVLQLLRENGARLVPVAMAEGLAGWDLPAWRRVLRETAPRLAYVIADFHNPTGALADEEQRRELVAAARASGTLLVVDETMRDLDLLPGRTPPRPVSAFDPGGSGVITIGSVSKTFWAGLRIGWVRAAPETVRGLIAGRAYTDLGSPVLEQLAVARLLRGDGWDAAIATRREQITRNRDELTAELCRQLPSWEYQLPTGGMTLWVRAGGLSGSRVADLGERLGVRVPAGTRFGVDGAFEGYLRLPFTVSGPLAREAVSRLAAAAARLAAGGPAGPHAPPGYIT